MNTKRSKQKQNSGSYGFTFGSSGFQKSSSGFLENLRGYSGFWFSGSRPADRPADFF
mgnify:FL=1